MIRKYDRKTECLKLCVYAKEVAATLDLNGHETSVMDILDVLAQHGLTLQVSEDNLASEAYFEMLSDSIKA